MNRLNDIKRFQNNYKLFEKNFRLLYIQLTHFLSVLKTILKNHSESMIPEYYINKYIEIASLLNEHVEHFTPLEEIDWTLENTEITIERRKIKID